MCSCTTCHGAVDGVSCRHAACGAGVTQEHVMVPVYRHDRRPLQTTKSQQKGFPVLYYFIIRMCIIDISANCSQQLQSDLQPWLLRSQSTPVHRTTICLMIPERLSANVIIDLGVVMFCVQCT